MYSKPNYSWLMPKLEKSSECPVQDDTTSNTNLKLQPTGTSVPGNWNNSSMANITPGPSSGKVAALLGIENTGKLS